MTKLIACLALLAGSTLFCGSAIATQLVYTPVNPTFGGSGLNGSYLLSVGEAQGFGAKSGPNASPDLSGLENSLNNLGSNNSTGTGSTGTTIIIPSSP